MKFTTSGALVRTNLGFCGTENGILRLGCCTISKITFIVSKTVTALVKPRNPVHAHNLVQIPASEVKGRNTLHTNALRASLIQDNGDHTHENLLVSAS